MTRNLAAIVLCVAAAVFGAAGPASAEIKFGVLAHRGEARAMETWGALGDYLSTELGEAVAIIALPPHVSIYHLGNRRVDFLLTQPVQSAIAEEVFGSTPLVTINRSTGSQIAGAIIARRDSGISTARDLRGRRISSMRKNVAAGGYIFQAYYLHQRGLEIPSDFASHEEAQKMDNLVYAVRDGQTDAAFVRAGLLEGMARNGLIELDDFVIVDGRTDGYPFRRTTPLYPEWAVMTNPALDQAVASRIRRALLALTPDDEAARVARIDGFVEPLSLESMKAAMGGLGIAPFDSGDYDANQASRTTDGPLTN